MNDDIHTVTWKDGSRWSAGSAVFDRLTARLGALGDAVMGLGPVLARWRALGPTLAVDAFAPTEDDRAVFTAALARVLEEEDDTAEGRAVKREAGELHELFVTDVTRD